jgi:hypothetical protein
VKSGESGKLPLKFVGFAKFARPPSKLNSTAISENLPLRRSFASFFRVDIWLRICGTWKNLENPANYR